MATVNSNSPMALDDDVPVEAVPAKDNDGVPYCRKHHCRMKATSGGKKDAAKSYYSCPVAGCEEKAQKIKTKNPGVVPPQPLACPRCSRGENQVICERDPKSSTPACVILKCPVCGWKSSAMAVPQLAAAHFAARSAKKTHFPISDVGDR